MGLTIKPILLMEKNLHHLVCKKTCNKRDELPINWSRISFINSRIHGDPMGTTHKVNKTCDGSSSLTSTTNDGPQPPWCSKVNGSRPSRAARATKKRIKKKTEKTHKTNCFQKKGCSNVFLLKD